MKTYKVTMYVNTRKGGTKAIAETTIKAISKDMVRQIFLPNRGEHLMSIHDSESRWDYHTPLRVFVEEANDEPHQGETDEQS